MSVLEKALLSRAEARSLTDEVRDDADRLWRKLLELYEGGAHEVLGYTSWGAYYKAEFRRSDATAYRLLQSGRAIDQLPIGSPKPTKESVARELTPLLKEPDTLRAAWAEVVETTPEPTAVQVREVVQRRVQSNDLTHVKPDPRQPIPTLKNAAREVVATAVREGTYYRVPLSAMSSLILSIGKAA